jgi:hypothetical protein
LASMKGSCVVTTIAIVLSVCVASASAARSCGRAVIADWADNGELDRSWSCECVLDGLASLAVDARPVSFSMRDIERHVRGRCVSWQVPLSELGLTREAEPMADATPSEVELFEPTLTEFSSAATDTEVTDYPVPWDIVIGGMAAGGLVVLIGAAAVRQRRLRP